VNQVNPLVQLFQARRLYHPNQLIQSLPVLQASHWIQELRPALLDRQNRSLPYFRQILESH